MNPQSSLENRLKLISLKADFRIQERRSKNEEAFLEYIRVMKRGSSTSKNLEESSIYVEKFCLKTSSLGLILQNSNGSFTSESITFNDTSLHVLGMLKEIAAVEV